MLALHDATLVELDPPRVRQATLTVAEGRIAAILEPSAPSPPGAERIDCAGALVMPGFVCAHTHLYSALARGMPPPRDPPGNFTQILERIWWKLDRALDEDMVRLSALVGAVEALKAGTTTLVDHHASPRALDGSLDLVGHAIETVGLRGVLCYETSDRGGSDEARAGVRENDRFLGKLQRAPRPLLRGLVGAHAAFTLSDGTAEALADVAARYHSGVHVHVAEDAVDARKDGLPVARWLAERGLLTPRSLLAHCVHLDDDEAARVVAAGARVVHNPRSNANNAVGYARPARFADRLLLGTDGIGADMRAEALAAFLGAREHGDALEVVRALERNRALAAYEFGLSFALEPGAAADLIVLDYPSPTPLEARNLAGHLLFGLVGQPVRHAIVDGRVVLRAGRVVGLDEAALYAHARAAARTLWAELAAG
jgi:putative selenium metabolism protein SsnA